jgi:uncharacterized membrane protein
MRAPRWVRGLLSADDLEAVRATIAAVEARSSAEVRVHLERTCPDDPLDRAVQVFEALGLARTAARNGVLVYLAVESRRLAVIGDGGVDARVPAGYWQHLARAGAGHLGAGRPREGLVVLLATLGETLVRLFPRRPDDRNELPDDVSFG